METGDYSVARAKQVVIATGGAGRMHYQGFRHPIITVQLPTVWFWDTEQVLPCYIRILSSIIRQEQSTRHRSLVHW